MIVLVTHDEILVAIMPEKRVRLHLNQLVGRRRRVALGIVLEAL